MKKALVFLTFVFFFISNDDMKGYEYCLSDYPNIECIEDAFTIITPCNIYPNSPYCTISVNYCYRKIIENGIIIERDVFIKDFSFSSECSCFDNIYLEIIKNIWNKNDLQTYFEISQYDNGDVFCVDGMRIFIAPCSEMLGTPPFYAMHPCNTAPNTYACCIGNYCVCYVRRCISNPQCGYRTTQINTLSLSSEYISCPQPCISECDKLYFGNIIIAPPEQSIDNDNDKSLENKIKIINNFEIDNFYLKEISNNEFGYNSRENSKLVLSNYLGKIIEIFEGNIDKKLSINKFNYQKFERGLYFYKILVDGKLEKTGCIYILK